MRLIGLIRGVENVYHIYIHIYSVLRIYDLLYMFSILRIYILHYIHMYVQCIDNI